MIRYCVFFFVVLHLNAGAQLTAICTKNSISIKSKKSLNILDEIGENDAIRIGTGGYLLLADSKWNLFEFTENKIVSIDSLKGNLIECSSKPEYNILLASEPIQKAIMDRKKCDEYVYSNFPYSISFEVVHPVSFWSNCTNCKVFVVNEFDEKIISYDLDFQKEKLIDLSNIIDKKHSKKKLIFRISQDCKPLPSFYVFGKAKKVYNNINIAIPFVADHSSGLTA